MKNFFINMFVGSGGTSHKRVLGTIGFISLVVYLFICSEENKIATQLIGTAIDVHRALGPGLLESAYVKCLAVELKDRGLFIAVEKELPVIYEGNKIDCSYRLDLLIENLVSLTLKVIGLLIPIHTPQTHNHLKLAKKKLGLILSCNEVLIKRAVSIES